MDTQENQQPNEPVAVPAVPAAPETPVVEQKHAVFAPLAKAFDPDVLVLDVPNQTAEETNDLLKQMPTMDFGASQEGRTFIEHLKDANFTIPHKDWLANVGYRVGSAWRQETASEAGPLRAQLPRLTAGAASAVTGDNANMRLRKAMGMGTLFKFPCWHTGIWLTLKAPTENALLELNRRLTEEKIRLGRQTHGLAFSNNAVFFSGHLADFVVAHIQNSTLIETEKDWHEIIDLRDLPHLVWGLAYTVWPNGFQYARTKINPEEGSWQDEHGLLKLGALQWVDQASLTQRQVAHMAKNQGKVHNLETLRMYQEEFTRGQMRLVPLNENVALELKVPSIAAHLDSGYNWVNNIVTMVDRAFALPPDDKRRLDYIMQHGLATNMRQFAHWVSAIVIDGDRITEREDIDRNLDDLSGIDEVGDKFFEEVRKYEEDSMVSIIAVPRTPADKDSTAMQQFPSLLVIDPLTTFFTLLYRKVAMQQGRA